MTCRSQINGVLHPRHGLVRDTHLEIAEHLEGNLRVWLTAIHPEASAEVLSMHKLVKGKGKGKGSCMSVSVRVSVSVRNWTKETSKTY